MKLDKDLEEYWISEALSPRQTQVEGIHWAVENSDFKYLILEAPVGAGKSFIAMTISRLFGNFSFILTPQVILQKQYEKDFLDKKSVRMASFYGKGNYSCDQKGTRGQPISCAIGSLTKPRCESCPYVVARDHAKKSNNTVMNYALGMSAFTFTKLFRGEDGTPIQRNLMILDEAHALEKQLIQFDTISITNTWCDSRNIFIPRNKSMSNVVSFIRESYFPALIQAYEALLTDIELMQENSDSMDKNVESKKLKDLKYVESQINICDVFLRNDLDYIEENYVMCDSDNGIELKRIHAVHSFNTIIEPMAKKFLFMSSTIPDKKDFCEKLGIDSKDAAYISLDSEFAIENRPVVYMPQMKMNFKWSHDVNKKDREKMLAAINKLSHMHADEHGIIHTGNFAIAQWLVDNLDSKTHQIIHHNPGSGTNRNKAIEKFMEAFRPTILISPSITEGLDLKYDHGRFAIFTKVPFGNIKDAWIKKRMELSKTWYTTQAIIDIIQGGGRIVRAPDDEGVVYILDQSFGYLYSNNKEKFPEWWKAAYSEL